MYLELRKPISSLNFFRKTIFYGSEMPLSDNILKKNSIQIVTDDLSGW